MGSKTGTTFETVMPHRHAHVLADVEKGGAREVEQAISAAGRLIPPGREHRWHERVAVFLRAAELVSGPWRARSTPPPCSTSRRPPIRPRSTPPARRSTSSVTTPSTRAHLRGTAGLVGGCLEQARIQGTRGLRPCDQPVQLHGDRRQSDDVAGTDGKHGRLEACLDPGALGIHQDAHPRSGGPAARGDQPRVRRRRRDRRSRPGEPRPRRRPLHGLDHRLPLDLAHDRQRNRPLPKLPTHRRRDRRQGLHSRPPVCRSRRGGGGGRTRLVRVQGQNVLPRRGSTFRRTSGATCAIRSRGRSTRSRWAT